MVLWVHEEGHFGREPSAVAAVIHHRPLLGVGENQVFGIDNSQVVVNSLVRITHTLVEARRGNVIRHRNSFTILLAPNIFSFSEIYFFRNPRRWMPNLCVIRTIYDFRPRLTYGNDTAIAYYTKR